METNYRKGMDIFVRPGAYRDLEASLRQGEEELAQMPAVVLSCHDLYTRMLPFVLYDRIMVPASVRIMGGAMFKAGFKRTRIVYQLWNPNFRPSQARLDGKPLQLLLVSSMSVHSRSAFDAIRDAWTMGAERPLILAGGPKAIQEPYRYWPLSTPNGAVGPDVVVTGEGYVALDLLNLLLQYRGRGESLRQAFERARRERALDAVPGLVYLDPDASWQEPVLVDTGLQRLVQHFDELPDEVVGLGLLEPPHRRRGLAAGPLPQSKVRWHNPIVSLQITQGCRFNCPYCPIPALNQKTWRYRSPDGLAYQFRSVREQFGIKFYFGTDDNFFNRRQTADEYFQVLARTKVQGRSLAGRVRWGTEATQLDTWKNRDLLPLASKAGLYAIWFGIEDLTAELINKGQKPEVTTQLFQLLHCHRIAPMAMMMYHAGQPYFTPDSLYGLHNQVEFLRRAGAISLQCTVHIPAPGSREYEKTYASGTVLQSLGNYKIGDADIDANHVIVASPDPSWQRQLKLMGAYLTFYNPLNLFRAMKTDGSRLRRLRMGYQVLGFVAALRTCVKLLPFFFRLLLCKPKYHQEAPPISTVPVKLAPQAFPRLPASAQVPAPPPSRRQVA